MGLEKQTKRYKKEPKKFLTRTIYVLLVSHEPIIIYEVIFKCQNKNGVWFNTCHLWKDFSFL